MLRVKNAAQRAEETSIKKECVASPLTLTVTPRKLSSETTRSKTRRFPHCAVPLNQSACFSLCPTEGGCSPSFSHVMVEPKRLKIKICTYCQFFESEDLKTSYNLIAFHVGIPSNASPYQAKRNGQFLDSDTTHGHLAI